MDIRISWTDLKSFMTSRKVPLDYITLSGRYKIFSIDSNISVHTFVDITDPRNTDQIDFEDNYQADANKSKSDTDGRPFVQNVVAPKGWGYVDFNFNFKLNDKTMECESISFDGNRDIDGVDTLGGFTQTFQKSDFTKIADPTQTEMDNDVHWRRIDFMPTFDFVVVGGRFGLVAKTSAHARVWCIGVPDVPKASGGSHHFMVNKSLSHITPDQSFIADGRTAKYMKYDATYKTNKMSAIFKSTPGETAHFEVNYQIYVGPGSI